MQIVHVEDISARRAAYVEIPHELSENMRSALRSTGITQLYTHQVWIFSRLHATALLRKTSWLMCFNYFFYSWYLQAESIQASLSGKNVVVATMTSSGKSLCYNLPVLEALSHSSSACALYLFPTKVVHRMQKPFSLVLFLVINKGFFFFFFDKSQLFMMQALAQDQLRSLLAMTKGFNCDLNIGAYDGDTPQEERTWLRQNARLVIFDILLSLLPLISLCWNSNLLECS